MSLSRSHAVGVASLSYQLELEVFVQLHAGALVEDARVGAVNEVRARRRPRCRPYVQNGFTGVFMAAEISA